MRPPRPPEVMRGRPGEPHETIGDAGSLVAQGRYSPDGVILKGDCRPDQAVQLAVMGIGRPISAVSRSCIWVHCLTASGWWPR